MPQTPALTLRASPATAARPIFGLALLAAVILRGRSSFRLSTMQKALREMKGWLFLEIDGDLLPEDMTQIRRFVEKCVAEGHTEAIEDRCYRISGEGVVRIVDSIINPGELLPFEQSALVAYIIVSYRSVLADWLSRAVPGAEAHVRSEVRKRINPAEFLERQLKKAQLRVEEWDKRLVIHKNYSARIEKGMAQSGREALRQIALSHPFLQELPEPLLELELLGAHQHRLAFMLERRRMQAVQLCDNLSTLKSEIEAHISQHGDDL